MARIWQLDCDTVSSVSDTLLKRLLEALVAGCLRVYLSGWAMRYSSFHSGLGRLRSSLAALNVVLQNVVSVESLRAFGTLVRPKNQRDCD